MLLAAAVRLLAAVLSVWQEGAASLAAQEEDTIHAALLSITGSFSALESACDLRYLPESPLKNMAVTSSRGAGNAGVTPAMATPLAGDVLVPGPLALVDAALSLVACLLNASYCCWHHKQPRGSRPQPQWCEDEAAVKLVILSLGSNVTAVKQAAEKFLSALDCSVLKCKDGVGVDTDSAGAEGRQGGHCEEQQGFKCRLVAAIHEVQTEAAVEEEKSSGPDQAERKQQTHADREIDGVNERVAHLSKLVMLVRNTKIPTSPEAKPLPAAQKRQELGRRDTGIEDCVVEPVVISGPAEDATCTDDAECGNDAVDGVISAVDGLKAAAAKLRKAVNKGERLDEKAKKLLKKKVASAGGSIHEIQNLLE